MEFAYIPNPETANPAIYKGVTPYVRCFDDCKSTIVFLQSLRSSIREFSIAVFIQMVVKLTDEL